MVGMLWDGVDYPSFGSKGWLISSHSNFLCCYSVVFLFFSQSSEIANGFLAPAERASILGRRVANAFSCQGFATVIWADDLLASYIRGEVSSYLVKGSVYRSLS